ncbi:MAG: hypothetical protein ABIA76_02200 [Candidatus Diapherotrites archaeon]
MFYEFVQGVFHSGLISLVDTILNNLFFAFGFLAAGYNFYY